ncbi:MAG TPA: hypothetical protein VMQ73_25235 [Methylomirabilota bacterium]|nr:hypothetical protein [Methylomirabilota bacterium]
MKRRTKAVLLVAGLAVAIPVGTVVVLSEALFRILDPNHQCETGFSKLTSCTYHRSSRTTQQGTPLFGAPAYPIGTIISHDETSWAVADCPENHIARRLLCAVPSVAAPAQAASDDAVTGLPLPKPWLVRTAKNSLSIKSFHLETPLELAAVLGFYRTELSKRGWTENDGAVVTPDRAVIAFTTIDGPALLRVVHQDDRTIADLSLRKPGDAKARILPRPGQVRLMLGNTTDEEAVITINQQTIKLAARAGEHLARSADEADELPEGQKIDLPAGKYKVTLRLAGSRAQDREFEVAADETWGLLVGEEGTPFPVHLY